MRAVLLGALALALAPIWAKAAVVEIGAGPVSLAPGERVLVAVAVSGVPAPGVAAFQLEATYDPAVVSIFDPNAGFGLFDPFAPLGGNPLCTLPRGTATCEDPPWMLTATGRVPAGTHQIDNATGHVLIAYGTSGTEPLPSGDGALAMIGIQGVAPGFTTLVWTQALIADDDEPPMQIPTQALNATVQVAAPVPLLGTWGAVALAAALLTTLVPRARSQP